jgi:hypothetical protein
MQNFKVCPLIVSLALTFPIFSSASGEEKPSTFDVVQLEKLPYLEQKQLSELRTLLGSDFQSFENMVRKSFPKFVLVSSCQGSFKSPGKLDFALALINTKSNTAMYAAVLSDQKIGFLTYDLYKFRIKFSNDGFINGRGIEIICPAGAELSRINFGYSLRTNQGNDSPSVKIKTQLDAVCGSPTDGDNEFICFQYHTGNRKFMPIGGWSNE